MDPLTPEDFAARMRELAALSAIDPEFAHAQADGLMAHVLIQIGYHNGIEVFTEEIVKSYGERVHPTIAS